MINQIKKKKKEQGIDVHDMSSPLLGLEKADSTAAFDYSWLVVTLTDEKHFWREESATLHRGETDYCRQLSIDSIILWQFDTVRMVWFSESL